MKNKVACITLDLEPDHAGRVPERYEGWEIEYVTGLFTLLKQHHVPLSAFVVAQSLKKNRHIVRYMRAQGTEFYLHSYSHNLNQPDSAEEIEKGSEEFRRFFHKRPVGYRAPEGRISEAGYSLLRKNGFLFDSSVFPSFWPSPKYLLSKRTIHRGAYGVAEIPITTITPLGFIFSLSWIKFLGWNMYESLLRIFPLPDVIVFDFHLHDLHVLPATLSLPPFWKFIYHRKRKNGLQSLNDILAYLNKNGYTFIPISRLIREVVV